MSLPISFAGRATQDDLNAVHPAGVRFHNGHRLFIFGLGGQPDFFPAIRGHPDAYGQTWTNVAVKIDRFLPKSISLIHNIIPLIFHFTPMRNKSRLIPNGRKQAALVPVSHYTTTAPLVVFMNEWSIVKR